jgi:type VI secretion system protein ImpK
MIATQNQQTPKDNSLPTERMSLLHQELEPQLINAIKEVDTVNQLLLPSRIVTHHPKAGLNPLVDTAGYLFSVLGKLKFLKIFRQLNKLQKELIQEIQLFQENAKKQGYNNDFLTICRYVLCATFDDIISNTPWGGQSQWDTFSLLRSFNLDLHHRDKFFNILDHALKEPSLYIDLMELMYICLIMGYKGHYRSTEYNQHQLEQITNTLYKHIRAYRGNFTKALSPIPLKTSKFNLQELSQKSASILSIFFVTACINFTLFISLGYLMDVISNEAYQNVTQIQKSISAANSLQ